MIVSQDLYFPIFIRFSARKLHFVIINYCPEVTKQIDGSIVPNNKIKCKKYHTIRLIFFGRVNDHQFESEICNRLKHLGCTDLRTDRLM